MAGAPDSPRDGRQTRWEGHKEERRRHIIAAAIDIAQRSEPGAEIHVQDIAEHAGLSRTVVYRHFADRADLDRAVQATILEEVWSLLLPQLAVEGTVPEIIGRIIRAYVTWAVEHPALHRLADHDTSHEHGPLEQGLDQLAAQITALVLVVLPAMEADEQEEFVALVDPMVYGIVGAAFSAVRRWISRPDRVLPAERVAELVTESIWFVIQGHAASFGVELTRDLQLEDLVASVLATGNLPT